MMTNDIKYSRLEWTAHDGHVTPVKLLGIAISSAVVA